MTIRTVKDVDRRCPGGATRVRGRCLPLVKPDGGGSGRITADVAIDSPGKGCGPNRKRRGKGCVSNVPPLPPKIAIPVPVVEPSPPVGGQPPLRTKETQPSRAVPPQIRALVTNRPHRAGEVVVLVAMADAEATTAELERRFKIVAQERHEIALADGAVVRFQVSGDRSLARVLSDLLSDPRVLLAQPNFIFSTSDAGIARIATVQYATSKIRLPEAHALTRGRGVDIAIIDTAIDQTHPEIDGAIRASFDAIGEGAGAAEAHGTAITSIVTSHSNLQGVAPEARVLSVRAFVSEAQGAPKSTTMALVKGIDWAVANKARLFNLSFAGPDDALLARVIAKAARQGSIFVAAAGNGGPDAAPAFPAAYPDVIAVTATDAADRLFAMAGQGPHVAIAAPGVDILSAVPGGSYGMSSGTSLAAAHVSGVIALLLERDASLTLSDVRQLLARTARKLGSGREKFSNRLIDAAAATAAVSTLSSPTKVAAE